MIMWCIWIVFDFMYILCDFYVYRWYQVIFRWLQVIIHMICIMISLWLHSDCIILSLYLYYVAYVFNMYLIRWVKRVAWLLHDNCGLVSTWPGGWACINMNRQRKKSSCRTVSARDGRSFLLISPISAHSGESILKRTTPCVPSLQYLNNIWKMIERCVFMCFWHVFDVFFCGYFRGFLGIF